MPRTKCCNVEYAEGTIFVCACRKKRGTNIALSLFQEQSKKENQAIQKVANKKRFYDEKKLGTGVGTELHKMIPKFLEQKGCGCKGYIKRMNHLGPSGCEKNRDEIVSHLVEQAKKRQIFSWISSKATSVVADRLLTTAIKRARKNADPNELKWFCAITTAPRKIPTLKTCIDSMQVAGFHPFIFGEPGAGQYGIDKNLQQSTIIHEEKLGVWHNWLFSLRYAIENSDADIIMTVQDDALFHPDSKSFTEKILWPEERVGFVSLYTPAHYSTKPNSRGEYRSTGVNRIHTKSMWGACALVWPRKVVEEILNHDFTKNWNGARAKTNNKQVMEKRRQHPYLVQNSDTAIGTLMNKMKRSMWFVDPSPVEHFATTSAIKHGGNSGNRNCGRCADWDMSLEEQVPLLNNGEEMPQRVDYKDIII